MHLFLQTVLEFLLYASVLGPGDASLNKIDRTSAFMELPFW